MERNYTQTGQDNSFTWNAMAKGYEIQMPLIAKLRDEKKLKVETLAASGEWFRKQYKLTPATSVTVNHDLNGSNKKTVWFNSRFYRLNLLWENNTMRFRDIHLFNENFPSYYTNNVATSNECSFFTLPFVDGYRWSTVGKTAALWLKAIKDGKEIVVEGGDPVIKDNTRGRLRIEWPLTNFAGKMTMDITDKEFEIQMVTDRPFDWFLDLSVGNTSILPFTGISPHVINCKFEEMNYRVMATKGLISTPAGNAALRIRPEENKMVLNFSTER